ncbi:hypothetical protein B1812_02210 [Methylocystis bryophila]|uniref:Uncharacterized protein n=2 Tax=Methylocystis bryophila TaxID=655015 RepID=A0A1W6MR75_9HYPH|nr:hypothetical protein B1812_02210 [Methylocystis bryophila]
MAGLESERLVIGASIRPIHWRMLSSYLANLDKGPAVVCALITADLRTYLDLGATERAASVLIVLRLLLTQFPDLAKSAIPPSCRLRTLANFSHLDLDTRASNMCDGENDNSPVSPGGALCSFPKPKLDASHQSSSA